MINGFKSLYTMHKYKELLYCVRQVERVRTAALRDARYQRCRRIRPRVLFLDIKPPLFLVQYL